MTARPLSRLTSAPVLWVFLIVVAAIWLLTPHETGVRPTKWLDSYRARQQGLVSHPMSGFSDSTRTSTAHPIRVLHGQAQANFRSMVDRQSKSLEAAVAEYKRRYSRQPPPGFDKWFAFAQRRESVIIDDYDMIDEAMQPFWKLDPRLVKEAQQGASSGPSLWTLGVHKGAFNVGEENWMGRRIAEKLKDVVQDLPDFEIFMNPLDEPRILLSRISDISTPEWTDGSHRSSWDAAVGPCKYGLRPRKVAPQVLEVDTHGLPFVTDRFASLDVCQNPALRHTHGFFISPSTFQTTGSPIPILSQAAPTTFSDIIYPSMWYWDHMIADLEQADPPWEEKQNKMYWSGSTTGGFNRVRHESEEPWESHRHHFINITRQLDPNASYKFLAPQPEDIKSKAGRAGWTAYESHEVMQQLYDTKFTGVVQCDEPTCDKLREVYKVKGYEDARLGFKSRYLMDLDGNTFSGRFYNLLASRSCPLKQTIFREWHDERLVPWVHYVPISTSLEELPETMRYLALTDEGTAIAKEIADSGREWYPKVLRPEDAEVYLYRLFLEYARVTNPDRDRNSS